jgi:elongation of very long chain fatty acids protein 4
MGDRARVYSLAAAGANLQFLFFANTCYVAVTLMLYFAMKGREKGFEIKTLITVYNVTCVLAAGYVVVHICIHKWNHPGKFACNPLDSSPDGQHMAWVFWVFYAQKFWEFCDTWFFILRRSFRQVTFLHLFHHSSITLVVGSIVRFDFSGDMFLPILLNSIVHVLMYSHYLVTALGIKSWWRQHLTTLQLTQFVMISTQSYIAWTAGPSCGSPDWSKIVMILYMMSMLILFGAIATISCLLLLPLRMSMRSPLGSRSAHGWQIS